MQRFQKQKIVLLGDQAVGKTALVTNLISGTEKFDDTYQATIGIDFLATQLNTNGKEVGLHLWDTSGQEKFRSITESSISSAAALLIVYDVTRLDSLENAERWLQLAVASGPAQRPFVAFLGNKTDLADRREITLEDSRQRANELGACVFAEVSAKTGHNVRSLFEQLSIALTIPATVPGTLIKAQDDDEEEDVPRWKKCMCLALTRRCKGVGSR
eukprot:CAMPEP_0172660588 /NCGR_PEP_ID=MMETSP1074-20121228/4149_1 /TAXON_ID=2916 /ORGANISM="Ceratium fusus, Strain PA161109" /LENGTH=214 /DNA_ID=CAMNT_0013476219 /DNA_START=46 /DNA_END=690 /DNA_ORIENTATION=-